MGSMVWLKEEQSLCSGAVKPVFGDAPLTLSIKRPKQSPWQETDWFCFDICVQQSSDAGVTARFFGEDDNVFVDLFYQLLPNVTIPFHVQIGEIWSKRHFLPVFPGSFKGHCVGLPMNPNDVVRVEIRVQPGKDFQNVTVGNIRVDEKEPTTMWPATPLVDEMGQMIGRDWPTKTHSVAEMEERLKSEYEKAKGVPQNPRGLSPYGGYMQKQFEATGYFRTQFDGQRWWLVDPLGYAFFSHGMCYGTRMGEFGWFSGMEGFYQNPPSPTDPLYKDAFTHPGMIAEYVKRHGITNRSNEWMVNMARVNMMRTFGDNWWEAWRQLAESRFRSWGINTMGIGIVNFVDEKAEDFLRLSHLPYAVTLKRFPVTKHFIFRDFPDVFSPEYKENSIHFAENELAPMANDPYLLGYFLHNEPEWMFQSDCCIAYELLVKEEPLESRRDMVDWLQKRYGTIDRLNEKWGTSFQNWNVLLSPQPRSMALSEKAHEDLAAYEQVLIMAFGSIPLAACRAVDPHHLCLGLRHGGFTEKVVNGSSIFDVFSFNCYKHSPKAFLDMAAKAQKPVIIGEWHFGGQEIGLYRTALQSCTTQKERGKAYRKFLEEAAACPLCVGAHYFEYNDQSLLGRFDGEHMAHGIIDCTNRPYPPMAEAISLTSDELYPVLLGEKAPYDADIAYLSPHW